MSERNIGRVISIDSFRVFIELDTDIKGLYKNSFFDLHEVAKINSYVIIPVNAEKIVAMITKVKVNDETEIESLSGTISLPKSKRFIIATMMGTIVEKNEGLEYLQGVYNYPILDNPVWYIMEEDLRVIFDFKTDKSAIDFQNDYYLPIGTSPTFNNFEIKINPDNFFCKHSAILGNTGSGKSCTVSTILQSLLEFDYGTEKFLNNANIIILDTNGEYKSAFDYKNKDIKNRINAFNIDKDGIKIPYWFMNYDDFDYLFKPSANTQAPILKRAIELAKNVEVSESIGILTDVELNLLETIKNFAQDGSKHKDFIGILFREEKTIESLKKVKGFEILNFIPSNKIKLSSGFYNDINTPIDLEEKLKIIKNIDKLLNEHFEKRNEDLLLKNTNIDIPLYFSFDKLIMKYIDKAIEEQKTTNNKLSEYLSTLRLRLRSYSSDERFSTPFMLKNNNRENLLTEFIMFLMGILSEGEKEFSDYKYKKEEDEFQNITNKDKNQITIVDMSLLSFDVLENIAGLIGRIILEFLVRLDKVGIPRGNYPTVIVLEEAQNYIPERDRDPERVSIAKKVFERIAREGRKYGLSLIISSQRPSELSKTVLSQCNTFLVHRLQNPEDQKYIKQLVSSANEDILNQLPILPQQHAIIMGDAVRTPVQVKMRDVNPKPRSNNPNYIEKWLSVDKLSKENVEKVTNHWLGLKSIKEIIE